MDTDITLYKVQLTAAGRDDISVLLPFPDEAVVVADEIASNYPDTDSTVTIRAVKISLKDLEETQDELALDKDVVQDLIGYS